jgi:hypothetical protein
MLLLFMYRTVVPQVSQLVEQQGGQLSGLDVPALLHMYKARLAMACCNHKAAKKEVRTHTVKSMETAACRIHVQRYAECCSFLHMVACAVCLTVSIVSPTPLGCTLPQCFRLRTKPYCFIIFQVRALLLLQPSSPVAVLLKSQLEVLRQQPKKALKALGPLLSTINECTPRCAAIGIYSICIYMATGVHEMHMALGRGPGKAL